MCFIEVNMVKTELVKRLCKKRVGMSHKTASKVVETILEQMSNELSKGRRIDLRSFGSFFIKKYDNCRFWNPKTREALGRKTKIRIRFKVSPKIIKRLTNKVFNCIL